MLQIKSISKRYKTGDFVQQALDKVSLNLRDSEFSRDSGSLGFRQDHHCSTSSAASTGRTIGRFEDQRHLDAPYKVAIGVRLQAPHLGFA